MKEELSLLLAIINKWWYDYKTTERANSISSGQILFSFNEELKDLSPNLRFQYDLGEDAWTFKGLNNE